MDTPARPTSSAATSSTIAPNLQSVFSISRKEDIGVNVIPVG